MNNDVITECSGVMASSINHPYNSKQK